MREKLMWGLRNEEKCMRQRKFTLYRMRFQFERRKKKKKYSQSLTIKKDEEKKKKWGCKYLAANRMKKKSKIHRRKERKQKNVFEIEKWWGVG